MTDTAAQVPQAPIYVVNYHSDTGAYTIWQVDVGSANLFQKVSQSTSQTTATGQRFCAVGNYLLRYDLGGLQDDPATVPYAVIPFDPLGDDPLNAPPLQAGAWEKHKFWQFFDHYERDQNETDFVQLVPMTGYVMTFMPTPARGTFMLWNFDPAPDAPGDADPLPNAMGPQDAFAQIGWGSSLLPVDNYVLEWIAESSSYRVWNFDPQNTHPLSMPPIATGQRPEIGPGDKVMVLGDHILSIDTSVSPQTCQLWRFDPLADVPLHGPVGHGELPQDFDARNALIAYQPLVPVDPAVAQTPGTMDFMRENIDHVVVYMLESRTMDSVLGWLYEAGDSQINYIGADTPYEGNSLSNTNSSNGTEYPVYKFEDGKLSTQFVLASPGIDPFHATSDCISQQYSTGFSGYLSGDAPDMGGFVSNNVSGEAMASFGKDQLPVINGLAGSYAVSDLWFSPMPGGTIPNRGFALSGSNCNVIVNYEGEPQYSQYADDPRRQPIWKVLQNNGITDWKIYYSVLWQNACFTYHLFLRNQLPSVDANKDAFVAPLDQFFADAQAGTLPAFSFVEPAWIAPTGATSYHPGSTGDMVPGEVALKKLFEAVISSPKWDSTALVITFSKGGGVYDHVPTPAIQPAWPRDVADGFRYDVLGPRVPTLVVSPRVKPNTVFRSGQPTPFDGTSLISTVLDWFGVPRARWGMGDRAPQAPTFEQVFELNEPRTDQPDYPVPFDSKFPPQTPQG